MCDRQRVIQQSVGAGLPVNGVPSKAAAGNYHEFNDGASDCDVDERKQQ